MLLYWTYSSKVVMHFSMYHSSQRSQTNGHNNLMSSDVLWIISSLLKAQAIKSISAPFHIPEYNKNCRANTADCSNWNYKLSIRLVLFFNFLKQLLVYCKSQDDSIFIQWSSHQEIIVFIVSGLLSFHITQQTVYLPTQRKAFGQKPEWSP